jgi:tRNA-specific 2-thiouridylase
MNGSGDSKTVAVAMSGGVDSSVATVLLSEAGYRVIGLTMRLWDPPSSEQNIGTVHGCCSTDSVVRAQHVCAKLSIPHYVIDLRRDFRRSVVDDFVSEYLQGRTPNPCIQCNAIIKWRSLWRKAQELGAEYFATGHYARISQDNGEWKMLRAQYREKDQSYALWGIPREQLATTLLPLGEKTKREVRRIARHLGLATAEVPESQDVCFLYGENYTDFLRHYRADGNHVVDQGEIVNEQGEVLGTHSGFAGYTVGQRRGLGVSARHPLYVLRTEPDTNRVVVGPVSSLEVKGLRAVKPNWVSIDPPVKPLDATIQVRYRDRGVPGTVIPEGDTVLVRFADNHRGIAPGQSAVFYRDDCLLGGAIIASAVAGENREVELQDTTLAEET